MAFDPYHKWLAILPKDQPPNHYRLLGLELFESDLDVIEGAADRAMGYIRQYQSGEHAALAAKLLNEIAAARLCLLKPKSKADYDAKLKKDVAAPDPAEGINFDIDSDMADLMSAPKPTVRSKRKKAKSPVNIWIPGGIAAVVVLLLIVIMSNSNRPRQYVEPSNASVADSKKPDIAETSTTSAIVSKSPKVAEAVSAPPPKVRHDSTPVVDAVGPVVDLIAEVDLQRDTFDGKWTMKGDSLVGTPASRIYLPSPVTADYQLKIALKRLAGDEAFWIGFMMEGRQGLVVLDGWKSRFSGLYVDGREPHANSTTHPRPLFQNNKLSTIVLTVHPGHLHATFDGQTIVDWHGNVAQLNANTILGMPNRETPFLATSVNDFQVDLAELTPIQPEISPTRVQRLDTSIDVIPLLDVGRDSRHGNWTLDKAVLHSPEGFGMLSLPVQVPDEYTLSAVVELSPPGGRRVFVVGLPTGESSCSIPIVDVDGSLGLETIDGLRWDKNETRVAGKFLEPGKPVLLKYTVSKQSIRMDLDGRTLINWNGDFQRLATHGDWAPPETSKVFFGTETRFNLRDIKIGPPMDPPPGPPQPKFSAGSPLNLMSLIDSKRDAISGTWSNAEGVLRIAGDVPVSKLVIPCKVPAEYQLKMRVTRDASGAANNGGLVLNLPVESLMAEVCLDLFSSTVNGIPMDRLTADHPLNVSARRLQAILPNEAQEIVVTVRRNGIKVVNGHRTIIEWMGNPNRLSMQSDWSTPMDRIAIASLHGQFRFDRLELEALAPSPIPPVAKLRSDGNLMSIIDPRRDSRKAQWTGSAEGIASPAGFPGSRLTIPVTPPEKYVITAEVERKKGDTQFCLGLIVGGHPCNVAIDAGGGGNEAGLERLDDKPFGDAANTTHRKYSAKLLPMGKHVQVRCYVLPDTVVVTCGDKEVIRWHGDPRRFSQEHYYLPPNYSDTDRSQLWLGAWETEFLVRKLSLKILDDEQADRIASQFTGVFPTSSQVNVPLDDVASNKEPTVPAGVGTAPVDGGVYLFVNINSGRCLTVKDGGTVQGPFARRAGKSERWRAVQTGDCFKLVNESSGKVLAVSQGDKNQGAPIVEYDDLNSDDQKWEFVKVGENFSIKSRHSGHVVSVADHAKDENHRVLQWGDARSPEQIWRVQRVSSAGKK